MHLKVLHKFFSANLKTLDKATLIGIVWNYILEESIKENWETQMFGKKVFWKSKQNTFRTLSNIWDRDFCKNSWLPKTINYFPKSFSLDIS